MPVTSSLEYYWYLQICLYFPFYFSKNLFCYCLKIIVQIYSTVIVSLTSKLYMSPHCLRLKSKFFTLLSLTYSIQPINMILSILSPEYIPNPSTSHCLCSYYQTIIISYLEYSINPQLVCLLLSFPCYEPLFIQMPEWFFLKCKSDISLFCLKFQWFFISIRITAKLLWDHNHWDPVWWAFYQSFVSFSPSLTHSLSHSHICLFYYLSTLYLPFFSLSLSSAWGFFSSDHHMVNAFS